MDFTGTVLARRMVRAFKPDPVPREKLKRILSLAQHYPSAGYSQEVSYVVVTDKEKREKVRKLRDLRSNAPVFLIPCVSEKIVDDRYDETDKIPSEGKAIDWPI